MYFAGLIRLRNIPKPLLTEFDQFLKKRVSSLDYFTPTTIARELQISENLAWELVFEVRNLGLTLCTHQCGRFLNQISSYLSPSLSGTTIRPMFGFV